MSGLGQLINTAWTGLDAAVQALDTVSNNTANVNTPGYNVESVQQAELPGGPGEPGNGAGVTSIQRAYDQFVFAQMVGATSASQAAQVVQDNTQNLSAIFPVASGGAGGLGASLTSFFSAMNAVSQDPTSLPNRQALLSDANALEVVLGVSLATLCNFANNLGRPALNPELAQYAWNVSAADAAQ